jgi:hypothetical protein
MRINSIVGKITEIDVKTAIRTGDTAALRLLLSEDSSRANTLIPWG